MKKHLTLLTTLVAVSLVITACGPGESEPVPTETASSPTPSATPTVEVTKPALGDLVLTTEGLDELKIGATPPTDDPANSLVAFDDDACAAEGLPGLWLSTYPNVDEGIGPQAPFAIGVDGDAIVRIDVNSSAIYTDSGLHLGSSIDELLGVYPGGPDEVYNHADVSDVYVILGTSGKLMFEVAVDRIPDYWDESALDTVVYLSSVSTSIPTYGVAASGNVIGICNLS